MDLSDKNVLPTLAESKINEVIEATCAKKDTWASMTVSDKVKILREMIICAKESQQIMHDMAALARGVVMDRVNQKQMNSHAWGISTVPYNAWLSEILVFYEKMESTGMLPQPLEVYKRPNGQTCCKVGPSDFITWFFCGTPSYEVVLAEGQEVEQTGKPTDREAGLVGILGAGNYDAVIDILTAMFIQNKVVVYKVNPATFPYLGTSLRAHLAPLINRGFLSIVDGDVAVGKALIDHPLVSEWYMTGSINTFNNIMWSDPKGPKDENQQPNYTKPVVAELGGCSPVIVVPGPWSSIEVSLQAGHLAVFSMLNGGHICVRPQVLITCRQWAQRETFLATLKEKLENLPAWRSFYPGSFSKMEHFANLLRLEGHDEKSFLLNEPQSVAEFGNGLLPDNAGVDLSERVQTGSGFNEKRHPMIFATNVSPDSATLKEEAFCPVLLEVCLDTQAEYDAFLAAAVPVANSLAGNLTATIVAKDRSHPAVAVAVDHLKHGIVGVNVNGVNAILAPSLFWGGGAKSTIRDVQSGVGIFGNLYCLKNPVKAVTSGPFLNMAVFAQQTVGNKRLQPYKLFKRLGAMFLDRSYNMSPLTVAYWMTAVSFAMAQI